MVSLETLILVEDANGVVVDSRGGAFDIDKDNDIDQIKQKGISFDPNLPVEKPGGYYVRAVVKDSVTGKIGKAYRFLEIPDLKKKHLALSSMFVRNYGETETNQELKIIEGVESDTGPRI